MDAGRAEPAAATRAPNDLRILAIGAFPFPYPQGSQVFAAAQARALGRAGAEVSFASYGSGEGPLPDDLRALPSARAFAPRSGRSGPSLRKPLADAALVASVVRAQRRERFDVALAHNAEAAFVAAAVRAATGLRFVYIAHTVMREELSAYGAPRLRGVLNAAGELVDRGATASANAVIALSDAGRRALSLYVRDEIALIPPGHERTEPPSHAAIATACAAAGVQPRRFFLYAGNLDGYQELELLDAAARTLGDDFGPVVVATHDASGSERFPHLRVRELRDYGVVRALQFAATALVAPRRRAGGFPIKLLNYMEAARPIVAFEGVADGLLNGVSARLLGRRGEPSQLAGALAGALRELAERPALGLELGAAAHEHLVQEHDWTEIASRTLAVAGRAIGR